jgi:hypothetical protein
MKVLLILTSIILPLVMYVIEKLWFKSRLVFNLVAIISVLIFGNIASLSIYSIIKNKTVFMTTIHAVFLNPFFLITGGYLGIYLLYRLIKVALHELKN